jgi:hypothetical protein
MAVLEIETFTLVEGIDAATFRSLDERMQEWCYLHRPGLARRTTALNDNGSYVVITLFGDATQVTQDYQRADHPVVAEWTSAINASSISVALYSLL